MSPASRSNSKDKKASKESQKASMKLPGAANGGSGVPANVYNPLLGTFHTLDSVPQSSASSPHVNSRFQNIDETDEHSPESDSVSNNGSWSGESEDHKEKGPNTAIKQETTISGAGNEKREKIRQKNERKHQRQKERRAQELHERCSGYLMSRKLEALSQQLVAMGFPPERATMALILNEGRVEESVTWLFEGHDEVDKGANQNNGNGSNLKIDISEELTQIADMEIRYKCSKQEIERAVVACEGDLYKAAETLRIQTQDLHLPSASEDDTGNPPNAGLVDQNMVRSPQKSVSSTSVQQIRDEFNYVQTTAMLGSPSDLGSKSVPPLKKIQPKLEPVRPQQQIVTPVNKRRGSGSGSNLSAHPYPLASAPLQVSTPPGKIGTQYAVVGSESKNRQPGTVREPVIMMQRPKSFGAEPVPATSSIGLYPPGAAASWHPDDVEMKKTGGFLQHISNPLSVSPNSLRSNQLCVQNHQHHHSLVDFHGTNKGSVSWSRTSSFPTVAAASSLGLFSGLGSGGSSGSSSPVDWNTGGSTGHFDYSSIDWSLDRGLSSSKVNKLWLGLVPSEMNPPMYDSNVSGMRSKPAMRLSVNHNGVSVAGWRGGGEALTETLGATSPEWTSPFEGQDPFSLPRQFVSSPSL